MAFYSDQYISECKDQHTLQRARVRELEWALERHTPMPGFSWRQTVQRLTSAAMRQENLARHIASMERANAQRIAHQAQLDAAEAEHQERLRSDYRYAKEYSEAQDAGLPL